MGYGHEDSCDAGLQGKDHCRLESLDRCIENLKDYSSPVLLVLTILHWIEALPPEERSLAHTEYLGTQLSLQESNRVKLAVPQVEVLPLLLCLSIIRTSKLEAAIHAPYGVLLSQTQVLRNLRYFLPCFHDFLGIWSTFCPDVSTTSTTSRASLFDGRTRLYQFVL